MSDVNECHTCGHAYSPRYGSEQWIADGEAVWMCHACAPKPCPIDGTTVKTWLWHDDVMAEEVCAVCMARTISTMLKEVQDAR